MTEYELVDALASIGSNLTQGQALTISLLSAYMIVAYTAGSNLSRFQAGFISVLLVLFGIIGLQAQIYSMDEFLSYSAQLNELRGGAPREGFVALYAKSLILGLRALMFGGALTFMWRVRYSKTE